MHFLRSDDDFSTSVEKALDEIDVNWREYPGLIIAGTHVPNLFDAKLSAIKRARQDKIPFLGICFGLQLAVIEYARNVLGLKNANSTEIDEKTPQPVVVRLPELRVGIRKVADRFESHWHHYRVKQEAFEGFETFRKDWEVTMDETGTIVEIMRLKEHPFFVGTQFHGEYGSTKGDPHPLLIEFLKIARKEYAKN